MKSSLLKNKFLNTKSDIDRKAYNKQRNLCVSLIRSEKKNFFSNINTCDITNNKTFWKTIKPFFIDKIKTKSKITLIEKEVVSQEGQEEIVSEKIITEDQAVAEVFNKFFINIVPNLKISTDHGYDNDFIATDDQVNYRPVGILSNISKIYERYIYDQIQLFFDSVLSKYQCGFCRGYNAQHCLVSLIEKWKKSVDNGGAFGALLTDLSKAFDCLPHELFIAKLDAYGFDKSSLKLIHSYLSNRKQRVKVNDRYSSWSEILFGVPQRSILRPLLFNIFICDMFYFLEDFDIANYADDSTPYCAGKSAEFVVNSLEQSSAILFEWFNNYYMKVNTDKSHLLLSGNSRATATIDNSYIESEDEQVLLGITIDSNLTFENHINSICKKASQKLNTLARIAPYMSTQ